MLTVFRSYLSGWAFSSEMRTLLAHPTTKTELNTAVDSRRLESVMVHPPRRCGQAKKWPRRNRERPCQGSGVRRCQRLPEVTPPGDPTRPRDVISRRVPAATSPFSLTTRLAQAPARPPPWSAARVQGTVPVVRCTTGAPTFPWAPPSLEA